MPGEVILLVVRDPLLPRKASKEIVINPYRKPTQVDEERILRRLDELLLRNSAKWNRNFGIRFAIAGEVIYSRSWWWPQ